MQRVPIARTNGKQTMDARTQTQRLPDRLDADPALQALAERASQAMYANDRASQALGMTLDRVAPGYAQLSMRVRADMLNGHRTCHGGFIFALADSAFAFACNSRNQATVAAGCGIDYLRPGREGDMLRAEARERTLAGKRGIYDVTVTNQADEVVAIFQGRSHRIGGEVVQLQPG